MKKLMRYRITAGRAVEVRDVLMETRGGTPRGARRGKSSAKQLKRNEDEAVLILARQLNANCKGGDLFLTLKYSDTATTLDKYEEQTSVEPYYAKRESKLFAWLYSVVRDKKTLTDVEKTFCCVNIFAESEGKYDAWTQKAIVAVQSYGGSTKGLQLPYNIHWIGERTYGAAAITAGKLTFTPGSSALEG